MQQGLLGRISRSPIMEYHLFGIISEGKDADCHYLVAGVQGAPLHTLVDFCCLNLHSPIGDFTKSLVSDPPKYLWTRELKVCPFSFQLQHILGPFLAGPEQYLHSYVVIILTWS